MVVPQNGWFIRENPIKMGEPIFLETAIWRTSHCGTLHQGDQVTILGQRRTARVGQIDGPGSCVGWARWALNGAIGEVQLVVEQPIWKIYAREIGKNLPS